MEARASSGRGPSIKSFAQNLSHPDMPTEKIYNRLRMSE
jgi:hypothetical protein